MPNSQLHVDRSQKSKYRKQPGCWLTPGWPHTAMISAQPVIWRTLSKASKTSHGFWPAGRPEEVAHSFRSVRGEVGAYVGWYVRGTWRTAAFPKRCNPMSVRFTQWKRSTFYLAPVRDPGRAWLRVLSLALWIVTSGPASSVAAAVAGL